MIVVENGIVRKACLRDYLDAVKMLLQLIPAGKVVSYGELARLLGVPPVFVGKLLAMNDEAPIVPCHRVVRSNGELGGYSGPGGIRFKRKLLEVEGVRIDAEGRVSRDSFVHFTELLDP